MHFHQDLDLRSNSFAHRAHALYRQLLRGAADMRAPRIGERIELERREAASDHFGRTARVLVGLPRTLRPTVGVHAYAVAAGSAQQVVHGLAARLAYDVPH